MRYTVLGSYLDGTIQCYPSNIGSSDLGAVRQWLDTMRAAGQRGSIVSATLHNLEVADAAGHGDSGFIAQVLTSSAGDK